jgi:predicted HTH transcriptional regulator
MGTTQRRIEKLTKDYTTALADLIREQVLNETRDKVEAIFNGSNPKAAKRKATARKAVATRKKNGKAKIGAKRSPKALEKLQERVFKAIGKDPGSTAEEIAETLRVKRTRDLSLPLKKLLTAKAVRKTGERRETRYYPKAKRKK